MNNLMNIDDNVLPGPLSAVNDVRAITLEEQKYLEACAELGDGILSESLLKKRLAGFTNKPSGFLNFQKGFRAYLIVVPKGLTANFTPTQLSEDNYFYLVFKNEGTSLEAVQARIDNGAAIPLSTLGRFSFTFNFEKSVLSVVNKNELRAFCTSYMKTFNGLRKFFGLPEIDLQKPEFQRYFSEAA